MERQGENVHKRTLASAVHLNKQHRNSLHLENNTYNKPSTDHIHEKEIA